MRHLRPSPIAAGIAGSRPSLRAPPASTPPASPPQVTVLEQASGHFGELLVADVDDWRGLWAGDRCQGSCFIDPPLVVDGRAIRPGTVPEAAYLLAWLLPVCERPSGTILMAGLGSGVGVTTLLAHYPDLRITVIEIDDEVVRLALTHFPALAHFQAQGRVQIVVGDVTEVVATWQGGPWSLVFLDTYQHDDRLYCPAGLLTALHRHAEEVWLNVVDGAQQVRVTRLRQRMTAQRWTPRCLITAFDIDEEGAFPSENYLLGTRRLSPERCAAIQPCAESQHLRAQQARRSLQAMVEHLQAL